MGRINCLPPSRIAIQFEKFASAARMFDPSLTSVLRIQTRPSPKIIIMFVPNKEETSSGRILKR